MATWTGTGAHNANYTGTLTVTEQSYNVPGNSSTLAYSLVLTGNSGYYFQQYYLTTQISINGSLVQDRYEQISMPSPSGGVSTYTVCSGTVNVPHNADGTKTVTVWATMSTPATQSFLPGQIKIPSGLNGSLTLTTIPRESTMTVPSFTIESAGAMTISANSNTFSHTITYSFGGLTGTAASVAAGVTSASWTPPSTFYAKLPSSTSGTATLVLHTYSGGTEIGSKSYTATIYVGSGIKPSAPSVTLSPVNTNAWLNTKGLYVGGYTKLKVDSSATAGSGASISSYSISGAVSGSGSSYTSGVLTAGDKSVTVTATDSRGRTNSTTKSVTFQSYSNPSFSTFTYQRGTYSGGTWTANAYGNHVRVEAVGSVSLSASGNTGTKTVKIGNTSPAATSGNYYYFTNTNAATAYTVSGSITDSVGNTGTSSLSVATSSSSSTLTIPTLTIGSAATLTVSAASNTFTHTITYSFSGLSGTIASLNAGVTTTSWTPPNTFYAKLPNATSGTVSIVIKTYSGVTEIGSNTYNATVYVGSAIKPTAPTVTLSPVNTNTWINNKGLYVGGYSKVRVQSSASAGTGASMSSYTVSGAFAATGADVTSGILTSGNKSITVTATDSRGRTNATTSTVTFLAYTNPILTTFTAIRGTYAGGSWTSNELGDHIRVEAVGTVSLSANGNTGTITVKINGSNANATSGNYFYFTSTNGTTAYSVVGTIKDDVGNTTSRILTVPTVAVPFNINVDLPGVGVGMISQNANTFELAQNWALKANGKYNTMAYMPYSFTAIGTPNMLGYARIATVTIQSTWINGPIVFRILRRNDYAPIELYLFFEGASNTDPNVEVFYYKKPGGGRTSQAGDILYAFAYKTGTGVWDVYISKTELNDSIAVSSDLISAIQAGVSVSYSDDSRNTVPSGAVMAVPLNEWTLMYSSVPSTPTLYNMTGTASADNFRMWRNNTNDQYVIEARFKIAGFTRTGVRPYLTMQTDAHPGSLCYAPCGFRTTGASGQYYLVPEFVVVSLATSGLLTFQCSESFWTTVSGGDLYMIVPHTVFGINS